MLKVMFDLIKWEYKVVAIKTQVHASHFETDSKPTIDDVQNDLNELGDEGWELASVQDISLQDGRGFTIAYLKKRKV
jgi:hypothetical protein